ncbi:venom dipeptidyl peptidase 4-like isoform X2 [Photinus pyralis]|uniref:venom dipeptidyl peptidase 4-like isoform X2 n=1 Tax=Photinus pyralis TaxID=7054 RepID=UPI00126740B6|nr:venom dipeptidyl peptidase 4-like isoform X2 [Photinus pyralis]
MSVLKRYRVLDEMQTLAFELKSATCRLAGTDLLHCIEFHVLHNKKHLQTAQWAPQGIGLVYIFENNIYYVATISDIPKPRQITKDGATGIIFNGVPDWVYEEEVLGSGSALWFSPNGKYLAFGSFDDQRVLDYHYMVYGTPGDIKDLYPTVVSLKYPKVGTNNPTVKVKYVNLEDPSSKVSELREIIPTHVVSSDYILQDVAWANDTNVVAVSLNRLQNVAAVFGCNILNQFCYEMYTSRQDGGWLEVKMPTIINNGANYLILSAEPEGNDFYQHMSIVYGRDVSQKQRLTFGRRVVNSIYGFDEERSLIYYWGTANDKPYHRHVYVYNLTGNTENCLSCDMETPEGLCEVASASFSKKFSYVAQICSGPGPKVVQVQNLESRKYFVWENNTIVRERLAKKLRPIRKTLKVPLIGGLYATVRLLLPPTLNKKENKKYPLIVNVYAGPNSNRVVNTYSQGIENYFVTNHSYIYAYIDGRGSGNNGNTLLFQIYRRLGTVEIEDQIEVTRYLQNKYKYIDADKTAIWGWSYGGFAALLALLRDTRNVFKLAIAVAPVTSFLYYDTIYTERYMGLPTEDDNAVGYQNADIMTQVEGLRNKLFHIFHGNADDNVHYQQSMMLAKVLERADIRFFQQSYPDEAHSLIHVHRHLFHTMSKFFDYGFKNQHLKTWKLRKVKVADINSTVNKV